MPSEGYPSLPEWIEDSYLSLERYLCEQSEEDSFTHQQATDLIAESNPDFGDADINHAIDYLLNRGLALRGRRPTVHYRSAVWRVRTID